MLKRIKRIVPLFLLGISLIVPTVASAEIQSGSKTDTKGYITYSLNCVFRVVSNDTAQATTKWKGKTGYKVKTILYQCQNVFDAYHAVGTALEPSIATVTVSMSGVWKFKSKHYLHTNKTSTSNAINDLLTTFTDW